MAELLIAMKFVKLFFDYFFGLGATLVLLDLLFFRGNIEDMVALPQPLKYIIGVSIAIYWVARTGWYFVSKRLEYKERMLEILRKEKEFFGN